MKLEKRQGEAREAVLRARVAELIAEKTKLDAEVITLRTALESAQAAAAPEEGERKRDLPLGLGAGGGGGRLGWGEDFYHDAAEKMLQEALGGTLDLVAVGCIAADAHDAKSGEQSSAAEAGNAAVVDAGRATAAVGGEAATMTMSMS